MGREVRRVAPDWEHPKNENGHFMPQFDRSYEDRLAEWISGRDAWKTNPQNDCTYEEWCGNAPDPDYYMYRDEVPPIEARTHYQMYEDCSEGTPISPVMDSPESLAKWLTENNASSFAGMTASYDAWLRVCNGGFAPSMVMSGGALYSGVEFLATKGNP